MEYADRRDGDMSTKIEWTDETWNPITGCRKISDGCKNCYAERMAKRLAGRYGYPADDPFKPTFHEDRLKIPLKWKKPRRIFVCSMSDFFGAGLEQMCKILQVIDKCPQHTFMILTKRVLELATFNHVCGWPDDQKNLWIGVSVENQAAADERIPVLLDTPVAVRFVSCEPLLGYVDFQRLTLNRPTLDWVIAGAETGPGARPMEVAWAHDLMYQCKEEGIPFFMKQMSKKAPIPDDLMIREFPD